nr:hypothetical protein CFP56_25719 [Quercus suber]
MGSNSGYGDGLSWELLDDRVCGYAGFGQTSATYRLLVRIDSRCESFASLPECSFVSESVATSDSSLLTKILAIDLHFDSRSAEIPLHVCTNLHEVVMRIESALGLENGSHTTTTNAVHESRPFRDDIVPEDIITPVELSDPHQRDHISRSQPPYRLHPPPRPTAQFASAATIPTVNCCSNLYLRRLSSSASHPARLAFESLKGLLSSSRLRRPTNVQLVKVPPFGHTQTSSTASHLHPHLLAPAHTADLLFELFQTTPSDNEPTQLPHKSFFGVLPFVGEDSTRSRHPGQLRLGFAPFKPP